MTNLAQAATLGLLLCCITGGHGNDDDLIIQLMDKISSLEKAIEKQGQDYQQQIREQDDRIRKQDDQIWLLEQNSKGRNEQLKHAGFPGFSRRFILDGSEGPVAFHAILSAGVDVTHIGVGQNLRFPQVNINIGNAYHPGHGLFIAPQSGLYLFSASVLSHGEAHFNIMRNNTELAGVYSNAVSGPEQGSVTIVTRLSAGDEVSVELRRPADTSIWGDKLSSFMGYLLLPL